MNKTAQPFRVTFTNGESRLFLAWSISSAREMAYSWMCTYRDERCHIAAVTAAA